MTDDYEKLIRAAADGWDPGHTQPFEDVIAQVNLGGSVHFGDANEGRRQREVDYARGQVEMIHYLGWSPRRIDGNDPDDPKRNIARDIMAELDAREMMGPAKRVAAVIESMRESDQNVQLDDIELWMHLEHHEDMLRLPILETFAALRAQNFDLTGDQRAASHYWDATDDWVRDNLLKHDLLQVQWDTIDAVATDANGTEHRWNATNFAADNPEYVQQMIRRHDREEDPTLDEVPDEQLLFRDDPEAPDIVKSPDGPLSIYLDIAEA